MNYTKEAWEEEQMSNLGCESVSDLIAEVKRLREQLREVADAYAEVILSSTSLGNEEQVETLVYEIYGDFGEEE